MEWAELWIHFVGISCHGFKICKVNVLIIKNYRSPHGFIVFLAVSIRTLCSQKPKKRKREVDRKNKETKKLCVQHSENFPFITMHLSCHHSNYGELTKNRPTFDVSFQSSLKINHMFITRLICIHWKSSQFLSLVSMVSVRNA